MTKKKTAAKVTGGAVPNASPTRSSDTAELPTLGNAESIFPTGSGAPTNLIVVGIGASAGGLAAFEAFLSGVPDNVDSGVAFVLVQHLAPDHKSALTELVRRYTPMRVFEVENGMPVVANCTYIIPPNRDMALLNGTLQLMEPASPRGQRMPIDFFFRSLAQDQQERAIGIVLSGTGSDGTHGLRAIKGQGGMAMAQTPESTEYDGMPRSAIAAGLVDYVLPPAEMAAQLITYLTHAFGGSRRRPVSPLAKTDDGIARILVLLRAQTGHDFSQYKMNTIRRRIDRRRAVHQIGTVAGYIKYVQQTPAELDSLFRDLLIGVTSFFRDKEAFKVLEDQIIPKLFANKSAGATIRVWAPGCSTGEEAYSLAILLAERQQALKTAFHLQIFATDIDSGAIALARAGSFPNSAVVDLSPERLARYFSIAPDGNSYRVHKSIRDMLVFSEQNVVRDPPFSRLDLISCRNLLIYMGGELQRKLIPLFHYALNPGGFLFLGSAETVGEFPDLFATHDRATKLYLRREDLPGPQRAAFGRFLRQTKALDVEPSATRGITATGVSNSLRELAEKTLLQHVAPAAALVTGTGDILYLQGRTGLFLELAPGQVGVNNIVKMAREGLRHELTLALKKATTGEKLVSFSNLRVKTNGDFTRVDLSVRTVTARATETVEAPLFLVVLEEAPKMDHPPAASAPVTAAKKVRAGAAGASADALRKELKAKEEYLHSAHEELETANEELMSSNEEMQSINEELQSTNEELETSKEEMQSVNEELSTVNVELQTKLTDLSRVNNDMNNLLAGTGIATVFVDHALRILRFTPGATRIINLIDSDVGRPVSQIVANFSGYDALVADTNAVLDTLVSKAQDVQTTQGAWFAMRIQPYRTVDNVIEGAVLTFVDIAAAKKLEIALRDALAVLQTYPATQIVELDTGRAVEDVIKRAQAVLEQRFEGQTAALSHIQTQVEHQPHDMKNDG